MSCCSCSKDVEKRIKEKLNLLPGASAENIAHSWVSLYLKLFSSISIYDKLELSSEFIQEARLLLKSFELLSYFKRIVQNDEKIVNLICLMAYCGLLEINENDDIWKLKQNDGSTVAHWAARGGFLTVPYNSALWRIENKWGETPAHYAAEVGSLGAPCDSELWRIKDNLGETPAHRAAGRGFLHVPYLSDLWRIESNQGDTPIHWAAKNGYLDVPYCSGLWYIKNKLGETPAHWAAQNGNLCASYESPLWFIQDNSGDTPAHWAARNGNLMAPHDSELWCIPNIKGETPAHMAAKNGCLNAPYTSVLWIIQTKKKQTPAILSGKALIIFLHQPGAVIKNCLKRSDIDIKQIRDVWSVLGYIRVSQLLNIHHDVLDDFEYRLVVNKTSPPHPEFCDFHLIFKNITQKRLLQQILKNERLCNLYCFALAGALVYLFKENNQEARRILLYKHHTHIDNSVYSIFVEYGLWKIIKQIAHEVHGVSLEI